jgi:predicted aldo/keto reductase-like oxidoreductase
VVLALWVAALGLAWALGGPYMQDFLEGIDHTVLGRHRILLPFAALAIVALALVIRRQRAVCSACGAVESSWLWSPVPVRASGGPSRRVVLRGLGALGAITAAGATGVAVIYSRIRGWRPVARDFFFTEVETVSPTFKPDGDPARIRAMRRLGRTNVMVSDISLGSGRINRQGGLDVARAALDRGLNYFDTAPDYSGTESEQVLGEALQGRQREKLFLATKFCVAEGHLPNDTPVPKIVATVEASLKRLNTDYVDLVHIHSCDQIERLMAPNIHEAFDRLKEAGKARFLGVSTHTPNLERVANAAIDSGRFDVMMLAYHFGMWPQFGHILERAKEKDIGIVAMKTLKGAKHTNLANFRDERATYAQAAFRWVLSNPDVSCLVISFWEPAQVDQYLAASGTALRPEDTAILEKYDRLVRGDYCQPHCGVCLPSCPEELPIHDVLRYRMYAKDYGWPEEGERLYAALGKNASTCLACPAPCAGTCPHGIPIRTAMLDAHATLRRA